MSSKDYLHEKAEESRHNETLAFLMFLAGAVFFVGGMLTNLSLGKEPAWFLIVPYSIELYPRPILGLALTILGLALIIYGISAALHYYQDRSWYMQELRLANQSEELAISRKSGKSVRRRKVKL